MSGTPFFASFEAIILMTQTICSLTHQNALDYENKVINAIVFLSQLVVANLINEYAISHDFMQ